MISEHLRVRVSGLDDLSKMANIVTGVNQGLELMSKGLELAERSIMAIGRTGAQFEQYNIQFETLLGNQQKAAERMQQLFEFAVKTPYELPQVVEAAKILEAYGLYTERALKASGDAAAAFGKQFTETTLALAGAATGEMERLKTFGITSAEITAHLGHTMVRSTKEGLAEISQAVVELFEMKAGGGMERLSNSLTGIVSNLADAWQKFTLMVSDSRVFETARDIFGSILSSVDELFDSGRAQRTAQIIGTTLSNMMWGITETLARIADALISLAGRLGIEPAETVSHRKRQELITARGKLADLQASLPLAERVALHQQDPKAYQELMRSRRFDEWFLQHQISQLEDWFAKPPDSIWGRVHAAHLAFDERQIWQGPTLAQAGGRGIGRGLEAVTDIGLMDLVGPNIDALYGQYRGGAGLVAPGIRTDVSAYTFQGPLPEWGGPSAATLRQQESTRDAMLSGWSSYYTSLTQMSARWAQGEGKVLKDVWAATKQMLASTLQDYIRNYTQRLAMDQALAKVKSGGFFSGFSGLAGGLLAGLPALGIGVGASLLLGGLFGGGDETDYGDADMGSAAIGSGAGGLRTLSQTAGVKAQSIVQNFYIITHGNAYYGPGGPLEMAKELAPYMRDLLEAGAV